MDIDILQNFYPFSYNTINCNSIINNSTHEYTIDEFEHQCQLILKSQYNFNLMKFNNMVFNMSNSNPALIHSTIYNIFNKMTIGIRDQILTMIVENRFTVREFDAIYKLYNSTTFKLIKKLSFFDNLFMSANNKYSHINLIKNYLFYWNVINFKYLDTNSNSKYLYEIITIEIVMNPNIDEINSMFQMYVYYMKLSRIPKLNRETLFNSSIENLFLNSNDLAQSQLISKKLNIYINNLIVANVKKDQLVKFMKYMVEYYQDIDIFAMYYEIFFESRLVTYGYTHDDYKANIELELELVDQFKSVCERLIHNVKYKIQDMNENRFNNNAYRSEDVEIGTTIKSDKYAGKINIDKINFRILNPTIFRKQAWTNFKSCQGSGITCPLELSPYIDHYTEYYKKLYEHRALEWDFTQGVGTVNLKLGDQTYQLKLTTMQMCVLAQFKNNDNTNTPVQIAKCLNIKLSELTLIINIFLKTRILIRDQDFKPNDPNMKLFLNDNFKYPQTKISLVNLDKQEKISKFIQIDKLIGEQSAINKDTVFEAKLVRIMKNSKVLPYDTLINMIKLDIKFAYDDSMIKQAIKMALDDEYVKYCPETKAFTYIEP